MANTAGTACVAGNVASLTWSSAGVSESGSAEPGRPFFAQIDVSPSTRALIRTLLQQAGDDGSITLSATGASSTATLELIVGYDAPSSEDARSASGTPGVRESVVIPNAASRSAYYVTVKTSEATTVSFLGEMGNTDNTVQTSGNGGSSSSSGTSIWLFVGIGAGVVLLVAMIVAIVVVRKRSSSGGAYAFDASSFQTHDEYDATNLDPIGMATAAKSAPAIPPARPTPPPTTVLERVVTKYAFSGSNADELTFAKGDRLVVYEIHDDGWATGSFANNMGSRGVFPYNYVEVEQEAPPPSRPTFRPPPIAASAPATKPLPKPLPKPMPKTSFSAGPKTAPKPMPKPKPKPKPKTSFSAGPRTAPKPMPKPKPAPKRF